MTGYPIELHLNGRPVLVVGLGAVGRRKASGLVTAGARVTGVDPIAVALEGVEHLAESYQITHLQDMALVFAAATPEVNRDVVANARRLGVWVNSADDPASGDFTLPAVGRVGGVTLTVSTSGASPALAVALRDHALATLPPGASELAALFAELRPLVRAAGRDRSRSATATPRAVPLGRSPLARPPSRGRSRRRPRRAVERRRGGVFLNSRCAERTQFFA